MDGILHEFAKLTPDFQQIVRVTIRLLAALAIGTAIGLQRELTHKPAGLRTHMLVALGSSLILIGIAEAGMDQAALSRVMQGLITGIGFLGGGAILKLTNEREIHGLTTAAGIWATAAASAVAGIGQIAVAMIGTAFGLLILVVFRRFEKELGHHLHKDSEAHPHSNPESKDVA